MRLLAVVVSIVPQVAPGTHESSAAAARLGSSSPMLSPDEPVKRRVSAQSAAGAGISALTRRASGDELDDAVRDQADVAAMRQTGEALNREGARISELIEVLKHGRAQIDAVALELPPQVRARRLGAHVTVAVPLRWKGGASDTTREGDSDATHAEAVLMRHVLSTYDR